MAKFLKKKKNHAI